MEHTVLVVEDEKGIRESLKLFLKSHNYEVVEAENGAEALKKISPDIHLAIVDIMMPVMDGMTFVSRLRETLKYDKDVLFKLKELWAHMYIMFDHSKKPLKHLRKAQNLEDYHKALDEMLECGINNSEEI